MVETIEFITSGDRLISCRISEIAIIQEGYRSSIETEIYFAGSSNRFIVKGSYTEVMGKIKGIAHDYI